MARFSRQRGAAAPGEGSRQIWSGLGERPLQVGAPYRPPDFSSAGSSRGLPTTMSSVGETGNSERRKRMEIIKRNQGRRKDSEWINQDGSDTAVELKWEERRRQHSLEKKEAATKSRLVNTACNRAPSAGSDTESFSLDASGLLPPVRSPGSTLRGPRSGIGRSSAHSGRETESERGWPSRAQPGRTQETQPPPAPSFTQPAWPRSLDKITDHTSSRGGDGTSCAALRGIIVPPAPSAAPRFVRREMEKRQTERHTQRKAQAASALQRMYRAHAARRNDQEMHKERLFAAEAIQRAYLQHRCSVEAELRRELARRRAAAATRIQAAQRGRRVRERGCHAAFGVQGREEATMESSIDSSPTSPMSALAEASIRDLINESLYDVGPLAVNEHGDCWPEEEARKSASFIEMIAMEGDQDDLGLM